MANRVVVAEVKEIMDASLSDDDITAHITIANNLVTVTLGSSGLSALSLKDIERYMAAHLLSIGRDKLVGGTKAEWLASEAKVDFSNDLGKFLDSTLYGQMAKTLDTTGTLSTLGKPQARFRAIG